MGKIKAVLFDLHGTLVYVKDPVKDEEISEYLFSRGYEVSPQQWKAAWAFVSFIDYPKYGYKNLHSCLSRVLWRLKVKVDGKTLDHVVKLLESRPYELYTDALQAVVKAKRQGFKTAIVTTIAYFKFKNVIQPIRKCIDFVMTGYEAGCDKSDPRMYLKVLQILGVEPSEAVMIGDDTQLDILLPRRLGINTILLDREGGDRGESVDTSVRDLNEAVERVLTHYSNRDK